MLHFADLSKLLEVCNASHYIAFLCIWRIDSPLLHLKSVKYWRGRAMQLRQSPSWIRIHTWHLSVHFAQSSVHSACQHLIHKGAFHTWRLRKSEKRSQKYPVTLNVQTNFSRIGKRGSKYKRSNMDVLYGGTGLRRASAYRKWRKLQRERRNEVDAFEIVR